VSRQASAKPIRKLNAAAGGMVAIGTPVGVIVVYLIEQASAEPLPSAVAGAVVAVCAAVVGYLCGYLTPPAEGDELLRERASRGGGIQ
jgi:hypothetical protein